MTKKIYTVIQDRINDGTLTLYDYHSIILDNIKAGLGGKIKMLPDAPYTLYFFNQLNDSRNNDTFFDEKLKILIPSSFKKNKVVS